MPPKKLLGPKEPL